MSCIHIIINDVRDRKILQTEFFQSSVYYCIVLLYLAENRSKNLQLPIKNIPCL